jgi:hypothetical protein
MDDRDRARAAIISGYQYGGIDRTVSAEQQVEAIAALAAEAVAAPYRQEVERLDALLRQTHDALARCRQRLATGTREGGRNRVIFDLKAKITPDARATYQLMEQWYGPAVGGSLVVTHGQAVGRDLWVHITNTAPHGRSADVRRVLKRCLKEASADLVDEPVIEVLSRETLDAG